MRRALRQLLRRPVTTLTVILALGAGIGSATVMFALVDGILLRPLPYRDADRLAQVWLTFPHWRGEPVLDALWNRLALSWEDLDAVVTAPAVESAAAASFQTLQVATTAAPELATVGRATTGLPAALGVPLALGRWFTPDETGSAAASVVVASWTWWSTRLGGDPSALGSTVRIDGEPFVLIGVLPRHFQFPSVARMHGEEAVLWQPAGTRPSDLNRNSQTWETVIRLRQRCAAAARRRAVAGGRDGDARGPRGVPP